VIRHLRRDHSLAEIATWSPAQAQAHTLEALQQISAIP
jgi:hypothetical protein